MRFRARSGALLVVTTAIALVPAGAFAQQAADPSPALTIDPTLAPVGPPLSAAESDTLARALVFDSTQLSDKAPGKTLHVPGEPHAYSLDVSGKANPDGSNTLKLKRPLSSEWDANVGADLNVAAPPTDQFRPGQLLSSSDPANSTGAAWASLGIVNNLASVDARVDGGNDQTQFGTTFQRSVPFGSRFSVTFRDRYALSDTFATPVTPTGVPVMSLPPSAGPSPDQAWTNQRDVKFNILSTGTTLSAGLASASTDPVRHNTFSADQKVYGPLHVTTSVTDMGQATVNKSITAAFKLNW